MPNFVSPGAMAGNALQQFLMQRELENQERMKAELLAQREAQEQQMREQDLKLRLGAQDLQRDQFAAGEAERARVATRQGAMDAQAESDRNLARSREQNELGLRKMTGAGRRAGLDPETLRLQAWEEGMDIPPGILDPGQASREAEAEDMRAHQNRLAEIAAQGEQSRQTVAANRAPSGEPTPGQNFAAQTADRTISAIDDVLPKITPMTAGFGGAILSKIPGTPASNVSAELATVAGNIAFNALQQMREASKTGGALGQVSERELDLLSSVEASIRQNQSPENLRAQLQKVRESMLRFKAAQAMGGALDMGRTPNAAPGGGRQRWGRDAQGRPVRIQ